MRRARYTSFRSSLAHLIIIMHTQPPSIYISFIFSLNSHLPLLSMEVSGKEQSTRGPMVCDALAVIVVYIEKLNHCLFLSLSSPTHHIAFYAPVRFYTQYTFKNKKKVPTAKTRTESLHSKTAFELSHCVVFLSSF